jgi:PTS system ascorbate-specific IIA component
VLGKLLTPEVIRLNIAAADWEDAVRQSVQLLVDVGAAEPRYVDASVDLVREMGPYMVIAPGLALAHARPESGVLHNCLGLVTLADPVEFGNPDNDPVDLVFALGAIASDEHVQLMADLAKFLMHERSLPALRKATEVEEVVALIEEVSSSSSSS